MMLKRIGWVWVAGMLSVTGCSRSLELSGKACPCVDGYYCNPATNLCVLGQLPDAGPDVVEDVTPPEPNAPIQLALGAFHSCALWRDGQVQCWGRNTYGELGYGHTDNIGDTETLDALETVDVGLEALQITAGENFTCAILKGQVVRCWGVNTVGQLGYNRTDSIGDTELPSSAGPVEMGGTAASIAAGVRHVCAVKPDGDVRCWGSNDSGQLGTGGGFNGNIGDDEHPSEVPPVELRIQGATHIAAGRLHTCAILAGSSVMCWGDSTYGQLGYGNTDSVGINNTPNDYDKISLGKVAEISAGAYHTCADTKTEGLYCWGMGLGGALGYGNPSNVGHSAGNTPAEIGPVSLSKVKQVAAGGSHTCVLLLDNTVRCWGFNETGQLGYRHTDTLGDEIDEIPSLLEPVDVGGDVKFIAAGAAHTCVILTDGKVRCWGDNSYGQLGYGNTDVIGDTETPGSVPSVPLPTPE